MNSYSLSEGSQVEAARPIEPLVAVVISDVRICEATCALLEAHGVSTQSCPDPASLLFLMRDARLDAIVLDTDLPGMDAPSFFSRLARDPESPRMVLLSDTMTVSDAVDCIRQGAVSVLDKPFVPSSLVDDVRAAVALTGDARHWHALRAEGMHLLEVLSPRERETFDFLVAGFATQAIADALGIALQTAKVHRSRVMQKLGKKSVADLVRLDAQTRGVDLFLHRPKPLSLLGLRGGRREMPAPAPGSGRIAPALAYS
jgi:FixJ family two-component response regulator